MKNLWRKPSTTSLSLAPNLESKTLRTMVLIFAKVFRLLGEISDRLRFFQNFINTSIASVTLSNPVVVISCLLYGFKIVTNAKKPYPVAFKISWGFRKNFGIANPKSIRDFQNQKLKKISIIWPFSSQIKPKDSFPTFS